MILFKATQRKNFQTNEKEYYPAVADAQSAEYDEMLNDIQRACSLTLADVKAAVKSFEENVTDALAQGRTVNIPGLGTFSPTFATKSVEDANKVTADLIQKVRARFRASSELKHELRKDNVEFKRVK